MSMESDCILHNKCEANIDGQMISDIGPNFIIETGAPDFPPCKFNKGIRIDSNLEVVSISNLPATFSMGIGYIGMWIKLPYSITDGKPSSDSRTFINWYDAGNSFEMVIAFYSTIGFWWRMRWGAATYSDWTSTDTDIDIAANTLTHIAFVWDVNHLTKKRRLFINGIEVAFNNDVWTVPNMTSAKLYLGTFRGVIENCGGILDNKKWFKSLDYLNEILAYINNEGFPAVTYRLLTPSREKRLYKQKIIVAGIDLYQGERILEFPKIEYRKTFDKDKIFINILKIRCRNDDNFLSKDNPKSPFFGIDYYKQSVQIIDRDENLIWAGELFDIGRNHRNFESTIITGNEIYSDRYSKIEYSSADWETGAEAVDNIFSAYGIENLNRNSIETSKAYLIENDCKIKVTVVLDDKRSLISVVEDIARNSSADFFDFKGELYFQIYRPRTDLIITKSISERDFMKNPVVDAPDKFLVNDYAIHYDGDGGIPATDSNTDNIGYLSRARNGIHSLQGVTGDSKITFEKKIAAQFIGEQYIRRTHKNLLTRPEPLQQINFSLPIDIRKWFDLFTFYKINFARESWSDKILETFKLGYDNTNGIIEMNNFEMAS